ncbi:MAG TPA: hypothetical protein DD412_07605 [Holosporales bacterium]|nr:hypothetical protein [Holosporales bacterium]
MKFFYYMVFLSIALTPLAHGSAHSTANTEMHKVATTLINEADSFLEDLTKLNVSDPRYAHRDELIGLAAAQKTAAERLRGNIDEKGNIACYAAKDTDIKTITESAQRIKALEASIPKTHTVIGGAATSIIGTRAVQKIGSFMGFCYKDGIAVSN